MSFQTVFLSSCLGWTEVDQDILLLEPDESAEVTDDYLIITIRGLICGYGPESAAADGLEGCIRTIRCGDACGGCRGAMRELEICTNVWDSV